MTPDGEAGLNYLCAGYRAFFNRVRPSMQFMAKRLSDQRPPALVMSAMKAWDVEQARAFAAAGRNDPCPCGSGLKFKRCHGRRGK